MRRRCQTPDPKTGGALFEAVPAGLLKQAVQPRGKLGNQPQRAIIGARRWEDCCIRLGLAFGLGGGGGRSRQGGSGSVLLQKFLQARVKPQRTVQDLSLAGK